MSKGPGRVSRAIEAILEAEPDNAFSVEDLCDRVYPGINRVEKKHRVSVLRAANLVASTKQGTTVMYHLKLSVLEEALLGFASVFGLSGSKRLSDTRALAASRREGKS